jgi:hypothetical protein
MQALPYVYTKKRALKVYVESISISLFYEPHVVIENPLRRWRISIVASRMCSKRLARHGLWASSDVKRTKKHRQSFEGEMYIYCEGLNLIVVDLTGATLAHDVITVRARRIVRCRHSRRYWVSMHINAKMACPGGVGCGRRLVLVFF